MWTASFLHYAAVSKQSFALCQKDRGFLLLRWECRGYDGLVEWVINFYSGWRTFEAFAESLYLLVLSLEGNHAFGVSLYLSVRILDINNLYQVFLHV